MKLSKLIMELNDIKERHGDLEVIDAQGSDNFSMEVQGPELIFCEEA
jgi:hypothetical protein